MKNYNIVLFCVLISYVYSKTLIAPKCDYLIEGQVAGVAFKDKTNNDLDSKIECYISICKVNSSRECIVDRNCKRCLKYHTSYSKNVCKYAIFLYETGFLVNFWGKIDSNPEAANDVCLLESASKHSDFWE